MLPTGFKVPTDTITRIWRTFTETGRIGAEDAALIDPAVVRSWRRCIGRANPLAEFRPRLLYTSPSPRDRTRYRMPSSA